MSSFEEEYLDVLQNIEMAIVSVYREHNDLLDYDVIRALETLWMEYRNEKQGRPVSVPDLNENTKMVYARVKDVCEFRLGRPSNVKIKGWFVFKSKPTPISIDEIMACLKRILKSVDLWHKQGGRQGYLYFIDNNID